MSTLRRLGYQAPPLSLTSFPREDQQDAGEVLKSFHPSKKKKKKKTWAAADSLLLGKSLPVLAARPRSPPGDAVAGGAAPGSSSSPRLGLARIYELARIPPWGYLPPLPAFYCCVDRDSAIEPFWVPQRARAV